HGLARVVLLPGAHRTIADLLGEEGLRGCDLLRCGHADAESQMTLSRDDRRARDPFDLLPCLERDAGDLAGDLESIEGAPWTREVDRVRVAARSVGEHGDDLGASVVVLRVLVSRKARLDLARESAEVIRRDAGRARVVRRVAREERQRTPVALVANPQHGDRIVDGPGLAHVVRVLMTGIHLRLVRLTPREWNLKRGSRTQDPSAAMDELIRASHPVADLGRREALVGAFDRDGDARDQELAIVEVRI